MTGKKLLPLCLCLLLTGCATVAEYTSPTPPLGQEATAIPTPGPESSAPTPSEATPRPGPEWGEQVYMTSYVVQDRSEPVFSPEYRLPKITNAQGIPAYEAINDYYAGALDDLAVSAAELSGFAVEDYSIAQSLGDPFFNYVDSETFVLSLSAPSRVCVLRTHVSNLGNPHPLNYPLADTFDLATGARLSFADLFTCSAEEARERVLSAVLARNAASGYSGAVLEEEQLRQGFDPEKFYLTEDSLVVYYPQGTLSSALGSPTFAVPYTELEDIFAPWQ